MYPNAFYRVSVKALIKDNDGKVLVVKEDQDTWSLPGGGLDHGEVAEQGLLRELKEELGIEAATVCGTRRVITFELAAKQAWLLWVVYDVTVDNAIFTPGEGVTEWSFIDPETLKLSDDIFEQQVYEAANVTGY